MPGRVDHGRVHPERGVRSRLAQHQVALGFGEELLGLIRALGDMILDQTVDDERRRKGQRLFVFRCKHHRDYRTRKQSAPAAGLKHS